MPDERSSVVIIGLPGVQRFITAARTTGDLRAGSEIVERLASTAARACVQRGARLIFPAELSARGGTPNRVVALAAPQDARDTAVAASQAVQQEWARWVRRALGLGEDAPVPATPGMPIVRWVCVPPGESGYRGQWETARELMTARRRVRDFTSAAAWQGRTLCELSPWWPAEPSPPGLRPYEEATLSAANWVKRRWRQVQNPEGGRGAEGFPSTSSIASAPYRRAVLDRWQDPQVRSQAADLRAAVLELYDVAAVSAPGETKIRGLAAGADAVGTWFARSAGPWVYPDRWQAPSLGRDRLMSVDTGDQMARLRAVAERGLRAAQDLIEVMGQEPAAYLAVVVADLDGAGRFLSGEAPADGQPIEVSPAGHREVSGRLSALAGQQIRLLEGGTILGVPIYAGGDDLLAFTPAATALRAAQGCHDMVTDEHLPTTSTAVLYFHHTSGLQAAVQHAQVLLRAAKERVRGKHALAVGYLRRSGAQASSIQPWIGVDGSNSAELFGLFSRERAERLSPRLLADLAGDEEELDLLSGRSGGLYLKELTRLVSRHLPTGADRAAAAEVASLLDRMGRVEATPQMRPALSRRLVPSAAVGVFLRQEAR